MSAQSGPDSSAGMVSLLSCGGIGWVYGWAWARGTADLEVWSDVLGIASSSVGFGVQRNGLNQRLCNDAAVTDVEQHER